MQNLHTSTPEFTEICSKHKLTRMNIRVKGKWNTCIQMDTLIDASSLLKTIVPVFGDIAACEMRQENMLTP